MKTRRPHERKQEIIDAALVLAREHGYLNVTREQIAFRAMCSPSAVSAHFGTMKKLRRAIMSAAVARNDARVISQGLAMGDSKARSACAEVKREAVESLL